MRDIKKILPVVLMLIPPLAWSGPLDAGEFETWADSQKTASDSGAGPAATASSSRLAHRAVDGQIETESARPRLELEKSVETVIPETDDGDYVIHFGAGASWIVPVRLSDQATDDKVLSVFSASWAPFGLVGELGFDMALARDSSFLASPNLKFFFAKYPAFSFYLEGKLAIHSHPAGVDLGGGGGLGMIFGVSDHLALELRASAVAFDLSGRVAEQMFGPATDPAARVSNLVVCPTVGARLLARF